MQQLYHDRKWMLQNFAPKRLILLINHLTTEHMYLHVSMGHVSTHNKRPFCDSPLEGTSTATLCIISATTIEISWMRILWAEPSGRLLTITDFLCYSARRHTEMGVGLNWQTEEFIKTPLNTEYFSGYYQPHLFLCKSRQTNHKIKWNWIITHDAPIIYSQPCFVFRHIPWCQLWSSKNVGNEHKSKACQR